MNDETRNGVQGRVQTPQQLKAERMTHLREYIRTASDSTQGTAAAQESTENTAPAVVTDDTTQEESSNNEQTLEGDNPYDSIVAERSAEIESLMASLKEQQQETQRIQAERDRWEKDYSHLQPEYTRLTQQVKQLESELATLKALQQERDNLEEMSQNWSEEEGPTPKQIKAFEDANRKLEERIATMEAALKQREELAQTTQFRSAVWEKANSYALYAVGVPFQSLPEKEQELVREAVIQFFDKNNPEMAGSMVEKLRSLKLFEAQRLKEQQKRLQASKDSVSPETNSGSQRRLSSPGKKQDVSLDEGIDWSQMKTLSEPLANNFRKEQLLKMFKRANG